MEYLVIDGYNVINSWTDVFNLEEDTLEECREKFLDIISNFQGYRKLNIIVVFDAHMVKGSQEKRENYDKVSVVFTREKETADNYIERLVYNLGNTHTIRVVTSDYMEQTIVLSNGGVRVTPAELRQEIQKAERNGRNTLERRPVNNSPLMSRIKPDLARKLEKMRRDKF
jgi:predicted RNA-binding protein with PIN domain